MVIVQRVQDWFVIYNNRGGYGKFLLSADSHYVWVYDVEGVNIIEDVYSYIRGVGDRMGLGVKAHIENERLLKWLLFKTRHDPTVSYDPETQVITVLTKCLENQDRHRHKLKPTLPMSQPLPISVAV